jgi:integrase
MPRKTLTDTSVSALKPKQKHYTLPDPGCVGHYVRVNPTGNKSYLAVTRDPSGKQRWVTVGNADHLSIEDARKRAREIIISIKDGKDHTGPETFEVVAKEWLKRHCEAQAFVSTTVLRRQLELHVFPSWSGRDFTFIKRSEIAALLDKITDSAGDMAADKVLAILSGICRWYASRHDDYNSPIVRGMRRIKPQERARERVLTDDEIRLIWSKCEGTFGDIVKLLLLTGQRRDKVVSMRWDDISDDVWSIPNGNKRQKGTGGDLVLPKMALDILHSRKRGSSPYVFPGSMGHSYFKNYGRGKIALDEATGELPHWQLHDLRRTARSLMSRAAVRDDHAERVLGHAIGGVKGVYDRHKYYEQKREALRMLAGLIDNILRGDTDKKVTRLRA